MKPVALVLVALTGIVVSAADPRDADTIAQTPTVGAPSAQGLRFAAVSLKPNKTNPGPYSSDALPNGGYRIVNESVHELIMLAYGASVDRKSEPDWLWNERYDLSATSPLTGNASREQRQAMMLALLEERFNFKAHLESHQEPAYDLVLARADGQLGPGLQPSAVDCAALNQLSSAAATEVAARLRTLSADAPPPDCTARTRGNVLEGDLQLSSLAMFLTLPGGIVGRPVVDKTGLTGLYRVHLVANRGGRSATAADVDAPDIFSALEDQLGLKLEESQRTVYTVIVDRIDRPTVN
jgi:uncharacterized protein (TIGR03435 family)